MYVLVDLVKSILVEHKCIQKSSIDIWTTYQATTSYEVRIYGELVDVYSDGKRYFCFDKGEFFYCGTIDNHDLDQTIAEDTQRFGVVMLAFKHLEDENYLANLVVDHEIEFCEELIYVLGFCSVKLKDGTSLLIREYIDFLSGGPEQLLS